MTVKNSAFLVLKMIILIFHSGLLLEASAQCCLEFTENSCIRCPAGMHLYRSNCIYDLEGCLEYAAGFDCSSCKSNYQLVAGACVHTRFPQGIGNGSTFSVFLQSTIKPDGVMQAAQEAVEADEQLWIDWYNFTLISNKTYMNKNGLTRNALSLMNQTVGNPKLQFIFTSSLERPTAHILLYRFTYELSSIGGFADCLLAVEMVNSTQNYLQLNMVRQNTLSLQEKWSEVKQGDACERYILKQMMVVFPRTVNMSFVKGYSANVTDGINFTMFFMDSNEGIVSYVYTADAEEMPVCGAGKDTNGSTISTLLNQQNKTSEAQKEMNNKNDNIFPTNQNPNSTPAPTPSPVPTPTPTPSPAPETNTNNNSKQATKTKSDSTSETFVSLQNLQSNPIYSIGYAVIAQKYEISAYTINALFYIDSSPILYGIYLSNNITYIRFTFRINSTQGEFQIASYSQADRPFIDVNPQTAANSSYANTAHNTTNIDSAAKPNPIIANSTLSPANCGKLPSEFIDITSSQSKDIFLPRINLLLTTMYEYLANTRIKSVKYNLGYEPSSLSKITYQIIYENMEGNTYDFEVAIVNNQFQLLKSPNSTQSSPNAVTSASSTVEIKPNVTESQGNAIVKNQTVKNATTNESDKAKTQPVSPSNTLPANKTNTTITTDTNKDTKTPQAPTTTNHPQAATNKTKLNNTSPTVTEISPKNYTSQPKYKSLITILKSLYHIPPNATVASMKTWEDNSSSSKYEVVFKVTYPMPLKDGTIAKISTYELTVNPSSFVSVQSQKIQLVKAPPPEPFEKPSLSLSLSLSPYLKTIFNVFTTHSPKLASFVLQSLRLSAGNKTYGGSVTPYNEKIQFSKGKETICFDVSYQLIIFDSPANKGSIFNLIEYRSANCSNTSSDNVNDLSSAKFVNQSNISQAINRHMRVFSNDQISIDAYQTYQQFCRVRFSSINTGERQVVIDTQSLTVLAYRASPRTLFTPHLRNATFIDPNVVRTLQTEMQKIYKLPPGSILLQLIRKTNDDSQIWLIDVFGRTQIKSIWQQTLYQNLKIQALYYPQQSFLKIVNATALDLSYNTFMLEATAANWVEVPIQSTFAQPKFPHIIASLKATYSSFLDNSFLVSFYREPNSQYSTLGQYIAQKEGARFQILVSKQFTNNYHINYLLTVRYGAISNTTELQNLQSIENSNITIRNCRIHDNSSALPKCNQCQQAYVLVDNACLPEITGCEEYFSKLCSKCKQGYLSSKDMGKCLSLQESKEDLTVNSLIAVEPVPQQ